MTQTINLGPQTSEQNPKYQTNNSQQSSISPYEHIMDQLKTQQIKNNVQSKIQQFNLYGMPYNYHQNLKENIYTIKQLEEQQSSLLQWRMNDHISTIKNNPVNSFLVYDVSNSDIEVNQWLLSQNLKTNRQKKYNQKTQDILYQQQKLQQTSFINPIQYFFNTLTGHTNSTCPQLKVKSKIQQKRISFHHETKPSETQQLQLTLKKGIDLTKRRSRR